MSLPYLKKFLLAALLASGLGVHAQNAPENLHLFLLLGQSNMAGRGTVEPVDEQIDPRILMLTRDLKWVPARAPVHFDKPFAGTGLCQEFARTIIQNKPNIAIGLVPCAMGGSKMVEWKPGADLYNNAVSRAREAMKRGRIAGILWHQGESDAAPENVAVYKERFAATIAQLKKDLELGDVPVVVGEIGRFKPEHAAFNVALPGMLGLVPNCALVSAEDLKDKGDKLHFDSASARLLGQRYATAFIRLNSLSK